MGYNPCNISLCFPVFKQTLETSNLEKTLGELRERLSMAELRVQQLAASQGSQQDVQQHLQQLTEEKTGLENKLAQVRRGLEIFKLNLIKRRD